MINEVNKQHQKKKPQTNPQTQDNMTVTSHITQVYYYRYTICFKVKDKNHMACQKTWANIFRILGMRVSEDGFDTKKVENTNTAKFKRMRKEAEKTLMCSI